MANRKMNSASTTDEDRENPTDLPLASHQMNEEGRVDNQPVSQQMDEQDENDDDELTEDDFAIDELDDESDED